ncbi:MAG: hypothetical protein ACOC5S_02740 [Acidobacteriota bacterium]
MLLRILANVVVAIGVILLIRTILHSTNDTLVVRVFEKSPDSWIMNLYALALIIPIPFHVMSVGLILQKRFLSRTWTRIAWFSIVISGCWLGVSLLIRVFIL